MKPRRREKEKRDSMSTLLFLFSRFAASRETPLKTVLYALFARRLLSVITFRASPRVAQMVRAADS